MQRIKKYFFLIVIILLVIGCSHSIYYQTLNEYFNKGSFKIKKQDLYDEFGGFGEGITIEVYQIKGVGLEDYIRFHKKLPDKKNWKKERWQKFSGHKDTAPINLVINYKGSRKMNNQINHIKDVLKNKNSYYSYYYKELEKNPIAIILFIVDIEAKKIYVIESRI